jgi:hypothetical protein
MNPGIDFGRSRISQLANLLSELKVIVTTPSVLLSHPELATTYVLHNESITQLIFLGGIIAEKASPSPVQTCLGSKLACKSSQRLLWSRK